jgi:excinuclease ABC subunit A
VGLHPRDTARLVKILENLRDAGNTVVVVEHEEGVMRAADQIVDLGPGHGESGGELVFQGTFQQILKIRKSLTGDYLAGRRSVGVNGVEAPGGSRSLRLKRVTKHNLRDVTVEIPLGRLVCITGVSGSGKSTLVRDILVPSLAE